jgi:hypothetical protein
LNILDESQKIRFAPEYSILRGSNSDEVLQQALTHRMQKLIVVWMPANRRVLERSEE